MLNPGQQQAVRAAGHCMICACPGSGKTTVLKFRADYLLRANPESKLLAVTFTSDAACELEERIRGQNSKLGDRLICGTFHSLAKRQIERAGKRVNLKAQPAMALMKAAYNEVIVDMKGNPFDEVLSKVEFYKTHIDHEFGGIDAHPAEEVFSRYRELMAERGFHDFSDLLSIATKGMLLPTDHTDYIAPYPVDFLLADEFQDTDAIQYRWIAAHIDRGARVTIVGDDDQSIYGFRFAEGYQGMVNFQKLTDAAQINLDTTYRCAMEILEPAAKLIAQNTERLEKNLVTENKAQGQVRVLRFPSRDDENIGLVTAIGTNGDFGNWAVLARTNSQLEKVEQALQAEGIPCTRSGRTPFWELEIPALYLTTLRSICTGDVTGIDGLLRRCSVNESMLTTIMRRVIPTRPGAMQRFIGEPAEGYPAVVQRLIGLLPSWIELSSDPDMADRVAMGLALFMSRNFNHGDNKKQASVDRVDRLLSSAEIIVSRLKGTLRQRLAHIQRQAEGTEEESDAVRLITLHASKGLEFKHVWIVGVERGVIPSDQSPIDEERRLFYVGMTRAKLNLFLSYQRSTDSGPSVFLAEAGLI